MASEHNIPKNCQNDGRNQTNKYKRKHENGNGQIAEKVRGLCQDCEKRKTCELPIQEGGIWRCKDYS